MIRIAVLALFAAGCGATLYLDDPTATREDDGHVTVSVTARCAPSSSCGPLACVDVQWTGHDGTVLEDDIACTEGEIASDGTAILTVTSANEIEPGGVVTIDAAVGIAKTPTQPSTEWMDRIDDMDNEWAAPSP